MPPFRGTTARRVVIDLRSAKTVSKTQKALQKELGGVGGRNFFTPKMIRDLARKIEVFYLRPMMLDLREPPPRRKYPEDYPVEYVSDKQRRYVMWLLDGERYKRTNNLVNAWGYKTRIRSGKYISFEVSNSTPSARYVVGLVGLGKSQRSIKRYSGKIQPFHQKTGWRPAYEIIQEYIGEAQEDAVETVKRWVQRGV